MLISVVLPPLLPLLPCAGASERGAGAGACCTGCCAVSCVGSCVGSCAGCSATGAAGCVSVDSVSDVTKGFLQSIVVTSAAFIPDGHPCGHNPARSGDVLLRSYVGCVPRAFQTGVSRAPTAIITQRRFGRQARDEA